MVASGIPKIRKSLIILSSALFCAIAIFIAPATADTPIAFGQTLSGSIGSLGKSDKYIFDALKGDLLAVSMSTTTYMDAYIMLYAPDGSLIDQKYDTYGPGYAWIFTDPLPANGTYLVLAGDYDNNETGGYRIFIQRLNNPEMTIPIGFGETLSATLDVAGEVDTYSFNALAGDLLAVSM
ncbi:MAG: hypothetical protein KJP23_03655, partial [Deltaproteobacteria bacterium]|nr:hypothetical protein [Deltaproteobacteria bacterium]